MELCGDEGHLRGRFVVKKGVWVSSRPEMIEAQFLSALEKGVFPERKTPFELGSQPVSFYAALFETQIQSRIADLVSRELKARGESFYTIGSAGHEGNAAIAAAARWNDPAFLHYRSGAFFIQRSKKVPGTSPLYDLMLSFTASREDPISGGRHKVIGSKKLWIPPQTSTIASHLPKAVGFAFSIPRLKAMRLSTDCPPDAIVVCSFGDASANHASALSAFNLSEWLNYQFIPAPILFVCEDNGIGISVETPKGWIEQRFSRQSSMAYYQADGLNLSDTYRVASQACEWVRRTKKPAFLHVKMIRLMGHAGSDIETTYKTPKEIEEIEKQDPLLHTARDLIQTGWISADEIKTLYEKTKIRIRKIAEVASKRPKLRTAQEVMSSVIPLKQSTVFKNPDDKITQLHPTYFEKEKNQFEKKQHMAKLLNWELACLMMKYPQTVLFGEDVGKKGGVYHVTTGLQKKFGKKRVFDSLLDETSILGTAIGLAQNGIIPIPEIQFLAYFHNAEDQLRGEAATLSFFSQGQFTNPMVIRVAGLAYQKGFGGHFHNDNSLTVFRDLPGVILAVPSNGHDAVLMLRECMRLAAEEQRIVVFVEPIALYMTKDLIEKGDGKWSFHCPSLEKSIPLGECGEVTIHPDRAVDLTIVTYGNGTYLTMQAIERFKVLTPQGNIKLIDLRWLSPLPRREILEKIVPNKPVLVVEECRKSGSTSEAVVSLIAESLRPCPPVKVIAAQESFIPLGVAATSVLPSQEEILSEINALCKFEGNDGEEKWVPSKPL